MPIVLSLSSCSLLPFLHVYFHVVVNWFPHLSIATTPNTSLPASWVNRKMCRQGYVWDSLKCFCPLARTSPPPPRPRQESGFIEDFSLHPWVRSLKFKFPLLSLFKQRTVLYSVQCNSKRKNICKSWHDWLLWLFKCTCTCTYYLKKKEPGKQQLWLWWKFLS